MLIARILLALLELLANRSKASQQQKTSIVIIDIDIHNS